MKLGLENRTALVFGAGGGLGGAIARALAQEGCKVVAADARLERAQQTAEDINTLKMGPVMALEWELSRLDLITPNIGRVEREYGPVEILVNNTGGPPPTPVAGQDAEQWEAYFRSMVLPVIAVTDRVLPAMKKAGWGRIITSTSSGILTPIPNLGISNTLRVSLAGWSKTLAGEMGVHGITSNILMPGRIATQRIGYLDEQKAAREGRSVEDVQNESTRSIPLRRYGRPQEYANAAVFLASEAASYITGSILRVDGGLVPSI